MTDDRHEAKYALIAALEDGWHEHGSLRVHQTTLAHTRAILDKVDHADLPPFAPTGDGHVVFEVDLVAEDGTGWWGTGSIEAARMYLLRVEGREGPGKECYAAYDEAAFIAFLKDGTMPEGSVDA